MKIHLEIYNLLLEQNYPINNFILRCNWINQLLLTIELKNEDLINFNEIIQYKDSLNRDIFDTKCKLCLKQNQIK